MTQTKRVKKPVKRKNKRTLIVFWTALTLILAPFVFLGWILISAALDTGKPILGDRYLNDLNPAITKTNLDEIKSSVKTIEGVEGVSLNLATATLRVYADVTDDTSIDAEKNIANQIYEKVTATLDPAVYFSQVDSKKMYDLEIHVYTSSKNTDGEDFRYVIETKTSSMSEPIQQIVSQAVDEELAQQLRDAAEARKNPTPTPEATSEVNVGNEATQEEQPKTE